MQSPRDLRAFIAWLQLIVALLSSPLAAPAMARPPALQCADADKECAAKALHGHAVATLAYWRAALAKPLEERIGVAPLLLVEYLNYDNIQNGYPDRPRRATLGAGFLRDVRRAFAEIPPEVRHLLESRLAGIYFVENLGGTGYTDRIVDAADKPAAGFIVLDASVLGKRAANVWATWKENTPFSRQPGYTLVAQIEAPQANNRKNAIQYILLHELGHVLALNESFHPYWGIEPKDLQSVDGYPFFRLSWEVDRARNRLASLFDAVFPQRQDVVYYFGAKLGADQMVATYDNLERTNFASLYAATKPADDFAEAFASYVHTVLMSKPFAIRIYHRGKLAKTYGACWNDARCAGKRKLLESFLGVKQ